MPTSVWAELGAVAGRRAAQQGQPSDCEGPLGLDGGSPAPSPLPLCTGPWEHQAWHCPWRPVLGTLAWDYAPEKGPAHCHTWTAPRYARVGAIRAAAPVLGRPAVPPTGHMALGGTAALGGGVRGRPSAELPGVGAPPPACSQHAAYLVPSAKSQTETGLGVTREVTSVRFFFTCGAFFIYSRNPLEIKLQEI